MASKPHQLSSFLAWLTGAGLFALAGPSGAACTAGVVAAQVEESTPSAEFVSFGDATVAHLKTGLVWKRCAEGQAWTGTGCDGAATLMNWGAALQASVAASDDAASDWRVPNRKELESIVETCGHEPAINLAQFPNTPPQRFWTSTTFIDTPTSAWDVYFSDGYSGASSKTLSYNAVRLVRTAPPGTLRQSQSIAFEAASDLVVGGTVTVSVTATSGLPVSLAVQTPDTCALAGQTLTGLAGGTCALTASQAGDAAYYAAPEVTLSLVVNKRAQSITFGAAPTLSVGGSGTVTATATSGLPVALSSATPGVCTLAGGTVSVLAGGVCTVLGNQAGDSMFAPAPTASLNLAIAAPSPVGPGDGDPPEVFGYRMKLGSGWHLQGNSLGTPIDVAQQFGERKVVESVWKWLPDTQRWAFFTPQFNDAALAAYARSKGLEVLRQIGPGEGYWLKLKSEHDFGELKGTPSSVDLASLKEGWHLVTIAEAMSPADLQARLREAVPPDAGTASGYVSLWAWSAEKGRWYFYAPELAAQGDNALKAYIEANSFLDFADDRVQIGLGRGFWIRK